MEKKQILRESVKRLLELNISDAEIISNLKSVGVEEKTAREILDDVKSGKVIVEPKPQREPVQVQRRAQSREKPLYQPPGEDEDIFTSAYEEEEEPATPVIKKPVKNPLYMTPTASTADMTRLWEKGIITTVDAKLSEMERIKRDIDSVLDAKIAERLKAEKKKIEMVFESQRTLFAQKVEARLEAKAEEIKKVIEARAKEMGDINFKIQQEVARIQSDKKFNAEMMSTINEKVESLELVKSKMISETQGALINTESKFDEFMKESLKKRSELEARVNQSLELESKITEGLLQDARQKINEIKAQEQKELKDEIHSKMDELDELIEKVDPDGIARMISQFKDLGNELVKRQKQVDSQLDALDSKVDRTLKAKSDEFDRIIAQKSAELNAKMVNKLEKADKYFNEEFSKFSQEYEDFKKEVSKIENDNLAELEKEYSASIDELFAKNLIAWDKELKEREKQIDDIVNVVDVEKFNATMESLDLFKKQFLKTISESIADYNKSKKELGETIIARDKKINEYLHRIDSKMQQLSDFEKKFSKDVAELIGKIPEDKLPPKDDSSKKTKSKA